MHPSDSLYDWFDERTKADLTEVVRTGCCQQIVNALGTLAGIGIPTVSLRAFTHRTIDGIDRMMGAVRPDRSVEQNVEAVLDAVSGAAAAERRLLLWICPRCHPPTGVEQKTVGFLHGSCTACGEQFEGPNCDLRAYGLHDVRGRLASLEARELERSKGVLP